MKTITLKLTEEEAENLIRLLEDYFEEETKEERRFNKAFDKILESILRKLYDNE